MRSTFHGLETAKRGMFTQQSALYTTGHNISNANTPGYTRQRINFQTTLPYPGIGMNRPQIPGQMGTGVEAGSVQRVRDSFLDLQFRGQNQTLGYYEAKASSLSQMEGILNEFSTDGISKVMGQFWQSLQDLSGNPENRGPRTVVLERGKAVADTFHYVYNSLTTIKKDLANEIGVSVTEVNSLLKQISEINKQIGEIEPHGYLPNDLYDQRDVLVDQLSKYVNIKVEKVPSGGNASPIAEGQYNIKLIGADGTEQGDLVVEDIPSVIGMDPATDSDGDGVLDTPTGNVTNVTLNGAQISVSDFSKGKLKGIIETFGYGADQGAYPEMLKKLDKMAYEFATEFNKQHGLGVDFNGVDGKPFFDGVTSEAGAAANIFVAITDPNEIAAATKPSSPPVPPAPPVDQGDGSNALALSKVKEKPLAGLGSATIDSFYQGMIGRLGVETQEAKRQAANSGILLQSIEGNRQSISSVSLDEEFTDMVRFQHAYNAAARNITTVDEMLDKVINGMGRVGL
ncbi:flagellar hook-associated protein FlgK [Bacillus sp. FJAT-42315]|uniref:flagellar hook-associated protein FlgK n=1 Tax=Bacillus sp. FJAT-42315 TaxID=2014077 RepID=UPI000C232B1A|nr:flagellar hook-associated protein FlgK [Bacillus sp. FJAT-42315]